MFAASKTGGVVSSGDPYWTSVSLLTNFENNLTFQDGSTNNFAITRNGTVNPSLNTPFSGGVGGSEKFTGSSSYLTSPANAALALGSGDFTVEAWCYFNSITNTYTQTVMGTHYYSNAVLDRGWVFGLSPTGYPVLALFGSTGAGESYTSSTIATTNTWTHIAASRQGTTLRLFVGGVVVASGSSTKNEDWTGSVFKVATDEATTLSPSIGNALTSVTGFISNARVVKGTAVYTSAFTPPTAPLTAITNTSLLITGTGQGMFDNSTFVDQGPNALTVTATGAPVYSGLSPFGNTYAGSVLFNGTSQYLSTPDSTAFTLGSGNFTVETWIYNGTTGARQVICGQIDSAGTIASLSFYVEKTAANKLLGGVGSGGSFPTATSTADLPLNQWVHVAFVRNGNTGTLYINGAADGTVNLTSVTVNDSTNAFSIGRLGEFASLYFPGYISNLRIVKGTAVYTANFTPSTTPLTAITNTSLLVRGDTGAFYDLSTKGLVETGTGAPAVTTQIKKFGNESGYLNGSSSLSIANSTAIQFGSGDVTIEFWVYAPSVMALQVLFTTADPNNTSYGMLISGGLIGYYLSSTGTTWNIASGVTAGAITANTWTYVALVRSGSTWTPYVNGTAGTTTTNAAALYNFTGPLYVGQAVSASYFTGYLDDIRITKGVARTITTPTVTFPTGP